MRLRLTIGLSLLVLALGCTSVQAQARKQNRQRAANVPIAQVPVALLDAICKLEPAQKEKITALQTKLIEDLKALRPAKGTEPDSQAVQKRRDLTQAAITELNGILTPEQREALRKAMPLLTSLRSANVPLEVVAELKLTEDQKKQIADIIASERANLRGVPAQERKAKMREMMAQVRSKIEALLTDEQKDIIKKFREKNRGNKRNRP